MLLLLVPVGLATVVGLVVLWPAGEPTRAEQAAELFLPPGTTYPEGRVSTGEAYDCSIPGGEGQGAEPLNWATVVVEVLDGDGAGALQ